MRVGVVFALVAISQERSSQVAVAWAVALVAMPFLVCPSLFMIFGGWRFSGLRQEISNAIGEDTNQPGFASRHSASFKNRAGSNAGH